MTTQRRRTQRVTKHVVQVKHVRLTTRTRRDELLRRRLRLCLGRLGGALGRGLVRRCRILCLSLRLCNADGINVLAAKELLLLATDRLALDEEVEAARREKGIVRPLLLEDSRQLRANLLERRRRTNESRAAVGLTTRLLEGRGQQSLLRARLGRRAAAERLDGRLEARAARKERGECHGRDGECCVVDGANAKSLRDDAFTRGVARTALGLQLLAHGRPGERGAAAGRLPHLARLAFESARRGRGAERLAERFDERPKIGSRVGEARRSFDNLLEGRARLDGDVGVVVHDDRLGHVLLRREGLAAPARAVDRDEEHGHIVLDRLADLEHAPGGLEVLRREEGDEGRGVAHRQLERRQLDQVVAVDERAVAQIEQLIVHASHSVLRLGALVREEGVKTDLASLARDARRRLLDRLHHRRRRADALAQLLDEGRQVASLVVDCDGEPKQDGGRVAWRAGWHVRDGGEGHVVAARVLPHGALHAHEHHLDARLDRLTELGAALLGIKVRRREKDDEAACLVEGLDAAGRDLVVLGQL